MPKPATAIITTIMSMTMATATLTEGGLYRLLAWLSPAFPIGAFSYSHGIEAAVEAGQIVDRISLEAWVGAILRHGTGRIDADLFRGAWRIVAAREDCMADRASFETPAMPAPRDEAILHGISDIPHPEERPTAASRRPHDDRPSLGELMLIAARADAHRGTAETALEAWAQGEAFLATCRAAWPHSVLDAWNEALAAEQRPPAYAVAVGVAAACAGVPLAASLTAYLHGVAANLVSAGLRLIPLGQTDGQRALRSLEPVVAECVAAALTRPQNDFGGCAFAAELASIDHETQYTRLFRS
jgi:urease accessory protein